MPKPLTLKILTPRPRPLSEERHPLRQTSQAFIETLSVPLPRFVRNHDRVQKEGDDYFGGRGERTIR